ncbi:MAG: hypothetical protein ISS44_02120 [Candidatus Omnitrophica bacterium]|nr:hypothetical protein [Candidatus Omnitrophota bacterium]
MLELKRQKLKVILLVTVYCLLFTVLGGCTHLKETTKSILAISTKDIENARGQAIIKIVDCDYSICYQKVQDILTDMGSYIYAKKPDLIAVYISEADTTPAGIFFKDIGQTKTQLEIASPSTDTKEYLATRIFEEIGEGI